MKYLSLYLSLVFICLAVLGCSSASKQKDVEKSPAAEPTPVVAKPQSEKLQVDLQGLHRALGLDRSKRDLGYAEKPFNTCEVGFGYPKENCRMQTLVSINFRLQCRDTEGTTSEVVTSAQMNAIDNKTVRWELAFQKNTSQTDDEGYGQLVTVSSKSPRAARLRLGVGQQFVYVRAGEVTRIVTPANWCH